MNTEDSSRRAAKLNKVLVDLDNTKDDGTAFGVSKKISKLINSVLEIYSSDLFEHIDIEKARQNKPTGGYTPIAEELNKLADMFNHFEKFISNFETKLNVGKVFDPSLETDTGIYLGLDKLVAALKEAADSFRRDAETLRNL